MILAIISDTHDNIPNIEKFLLWVKNNKPKAIIHCGDIATPETLEKIANGFDGQIYIVLGNMDKGRDETIAKFRELKNIDLQGEVSEMEIEGIKIAASHQPSVAEQLASSGKYSYVFYGHTHKPWENIIGNCRLINPGNLSGIRNKATFAVLDLVTGNLQLKIIERL